jgi:hypothetical protein
VRHLDRDYTLAGRPEDALLRIAAAVAGIREATARRDGPSRLLIREEWRPVWTYVVAVVLFPIGLLALMIKREATLAADASPTAEGTAVRLHGRGHEVVCDAVLAVLAAERTLLVEVTADARAAQETQRQQRQTEFGDGAAAEAEV